MFPVQSHWHYYIEILYILEGCASITCNQETYILQPKGMIFLPPQSVHSIDRSSGEVLRYAVLKFDANRLNLSGDYLPKISSIFRSASRSITLPITFSQNDFEHFSLSTFFSDCIREINEKQYGYDSYLYASISRLMIQILRIWRTRGFTQDEHSFEQTEDYSIHDILLYIDSHSQETIAVTDLAAMCNMSYSYFAKTFHKLYGQSCKEYIEFVRLSKVENLLLFTNYDLTYISSETGFSDCSHLIRVFKRKYHMTPKQYRKKYVEN
jgi:AraC-like DNA-binding protein